VSASTTLPGAPEGGNAGAQKAAEDVAAAVSEELEGDANVTAVAVVEPDAPTPAEPSLELSLDAFADMWPAVIESLEGESDRLAWLLREATPLELSDQSLTLAWPESAAFSKRQAEDPAKRELLAESIRAVTGASLRLAFELRADEEVAKAGESVDEDELVDRFKREFSAVEEPPPTEET
jgi:DNA polymerase-3 subunit gamma/tau